MQIAIIAIVVVLIGLGAWFFNSPFINSFKKETPIVQNSQQNSNSINTNNNVAVVSNSDYKDGIYLATGGYKSPAGDETVDISLTIKDDTIVAATFKGNAVNPGSVTNQGKFAAGYSEVIIGKSLNEVSLTVVNGSSLTPKGFMEALEKIKVEANI